MIPRAALLHFFALASFIASLCACSDPADHAALKDVELPALVPAFRYVYRGTATGGYQFSPDGQKLAWIGPYLMRSRLFIRDNRTGDVRRYPTPVGNFQWTIDSRRLLFLSDSSGAENWHLYMIELDAADASPIDLTPFPNTRAHIHQLVPGKPNEILVYHNHRDPHVSDLYRINLDTRAETLVARNPGDAVAAVTTLDGSLQGWQKSRDAARPPEQRAQPLVTRRPALMKEPGESFSILGLARDRSSVWALSSRGRDRVALVSAHPTLGWEKVVFEDPTVDVTRVTMSRVSGDPLIAHAQPGYPRDEILDDPLRSDLEPLLQAQHGAHNGIEIVSMDQGEQRLIVLVYSDTQHRYYLLDRATRGYTLLSQGVPDDIERTLAPMEPVKLTSRDGLPLHGYLTRPRGVQAKRLPLVLLVHGGPWMRTTWGDPFRSEDAAYAQFLANRGYAVLEINFRGSTGYGRMFFNAAIGEFGGKMQDDLLDSASWAIETGIADPKRMAIMGWSYGGYAALLGLTTTPQTFACGISLGGPTDLPSLIESFPASWSVDLSMWHDFVGDPAIPEDRKEMTLKSPLSHAQALERPVLIVQGASDVRVRREQAERMVKALRSYSKPVQYVVIPEMGHSMGYWMHRLEVLRRTEAFLHTCLGGRASRFHPYDAVAWAWKRIKR